MIHGANVRIKAVTGDDAITMAEGRVDEKTMHTLRHAYEQASQPLVDFTQSQDALAAQVEHVRVILLLGSQHMRFDILPDQFDVF